MTVPSIKFQCPKCKRIKLGICSTLPEYCDCPGTGKTQREWSFHGMRSKVRTVKRPTKTRMNILKENP